MKQPVFSQRNTRLTHRFNEWKRPYQETIGRFWSALSISAKLAVLMAGLILVMTVSFYGFAVHQTSKEIRTSAVRKGEAVAEALKDEVSYVLLAGNFPSLNYSFRRLTASRNEIAYLYLVDTRGRVLSDSQTENVGRLLNDRMNLESAKDPGTRVHFFSKDVDGDGRLSELCDVSMPIVAKGKRAATLHIGLSLTRYLSTNLPRIRTNIALFAIPISILAILIAIKLSRSFTKPLQDLARAASDISEGNYGVQLPLERRDELGEFAQAFNKMAINLKQNFDKVSDMANRDGLTGLYNARFFHDALTRELERVKRTARPFSLILLDGDKFKRINDKYGHPVGDQVLQHISRVAQSVLRGYDMLARYGGEEFIAMLPDATAPQAVLLGERLRKMVEQRPFVSEEGEAIRLTVSIGVAQAFAPYDKKELITQADQALYQAKESGRNKVVLYKSLNFEAETTAAPQFQSLL